ncbi:MAG: BsuBI/PstI family type II restriction endonuclease [Pseudonocardia sp.]
MPGAGPAPADATWARPSMCLWLSDAAYRRAAEHDRSAWLHAALRGRRHVAELLGTWGERFEPWYADNTRETLRDETFPRWLDFGALRNREGIRTTSSQPRWALTESFADLFDPALADDALGAAIETWIENHLNPGDMIKARTARARDRDQHAVAVNLPGGGIRTLEPGDASLILKGVVEQWAPARLGDPVVLTISEPGRKLLVADNEMLLAAGLSINVSLLLCDALLVDLATKPVTFWMIEAVASDGPIDEDRKRQFLRWAEDHRIPVAACRFLTAFSSRNSPSARRRLKDLATGTFAWFADEPHHELAWYEIGESG